MEERFQKYQNDNRFRGYSFFINGKTRVCFAFIRDEHPNVISIRLGYEANPSSPTPYNKVEVRRYYKFIRKLFPIVKFRYKSESKTLIIKFDKSMTDQSKLLVCTLIRPLFEQEYCMSYMNILDKHKHLSVKNLLATRDGVFHYSTQGHSIFVGDDVYKILKNSNLSDIALGKFMFDKTQQKLQLNNIFINFDLTFVQKHYGKKI